MSIKRVIIPAIVALAAAGAILGSSAAPAVVAQAPTAHVLASPDTHYFG